MNELIKITEHDGIQTVSAKELYQFLGLSQSQWKRWAIKNIMRNQFAIEHEDWSSFDIVSNGNETQDFTITIDFAKRLSMQAKTSKGEEVRQYFIACEKKLNQLKPTSTLDILEMTIKGLREQNAYLTEVKNDVKLLSEKIDNIQVINAPMEYFSIMGHARNIHLQISLEQAKVFGIKCRALCNQQGFFIGKIPDPRFGTVNTYPLDVLNNVIGHGK